MPSSPAEAVAIMAVLPLALACAAVVVGERLRDRRRRESLNRSLHELRRPLQALVLEVGLRDRPADAGQLERALDALGTLDLAVNGRQRQPDPRSVDVRALAEAAVARWRTPVIARGRRIELVWSAGRPWIVCDPSGIAAALDNLVANALEHGHGPIRVDGSRRGGRLRLAVADGSDAGATDAAATIDDRSRRAGAAARWGTGGRRGHGLRIVAEIAARHGGRFVACAHARGSSAVIELPLA